jgi:hypothetical protein
VSNETHMNQIPLHGDPYNYNARGRNDWFGPAWANLSTTTVDGDDVNCIRMAIGSKRSGWTAPIIVYLRPEDAVALGDALREMAVQTGKVRVPDLEYDPQELKDFTEDLLSRDTFSTNFSGFWLRGVESNLHLGWLCWEDDEQFAHGDEPSRKAAVHAWHAGDPLPEGWYRLNEAMALKTWNEGRKKYGVDFYEYMDSNSQDTALQLAMLGEERYG